MAPDRTITVLTTGRQDWGILRSTCVAIEAEPGLRLDLVAGGMHLSGRHGRTVDQVRADGFEPTVLAWLDHDPEEEGAAEQPSAAHQAATALRLVGDHLRATSPDAILLAGDRFETAAAALAATVARVPIAHLHGGDQTLGAIDDALRHAVTKLAHLHLVSSEASRLRVIALAEDPATVHVVGPPGLDAFGRSDFASRAELERELGIPLEPPVVVVTVHPETLAADPVAAAHAVAAAMARVKATYIVTLPNVDPAADETRAVLERASGGGRVAAVPALGEGRYWGLLRIADAMLGNSSSGIIEAPAIGLPVVNVGDRQAGRERAGAVIDVPAEADAVAAALERALEHRRSDRTPGIDPGLLDGHAGERVARIIAAWQPSRPPRKAPIVIPTEARGTS